MKLRSETVEILTLIEAMPLSNSELVKQSGRVSSSLYQICMRLVERGLIAEKIVTRNYTRRLRQHYFPAETKAKAYFLTDAGMAALKLYRERREKEKPRPAVRVRKTKPPSKRRVSSVFDLGASH